MSSVTNHHRLDPSFPQRPALNHTVPLSNTPPPPLILTTEDIKLTSKGLPARPLRTVLCLATRLPTTQVQPSTFFLPPSSLPPRSTGKLRSPSPDASSERAVPIVARYLALTALQSCLPLLTPLRTASPLLPPPSSPPSRLRLRLRARMPARSRPATSDGSSFPSTSEYRTTPQLHACRDARAVAKREDVWRTCRNPLRPSVMERDRRVAGSSLTDEQQLREQAAPPPPLLLQQAVNLHPRRGGRRCLPRARSAGEFACLTHEANEVRVTDQITGDPRSHHQDRLRPVQGLHQLDRLTIFGRRWYHHPGPR